MPNRGGTHEQQVKAGQQSHKNDDKVTQQARGRSDDGQQCNNRGNFAQDRERVSEAGKKGGKS